MIILEILLVLLKLTGAFLAIAWVLYTQWNIRVTKSWKEFTVMQRWFLVVATLGIFGVYTQWLMFWPAYLLRNRKWNPFIWWLDNDRLGNYNGSKWKQDYYEHLNGRKETWWIAFLWHMRNMIWNLQSKKIFKVKPQTIYFGNQNIYIVRMIKDTITNLVLDTSIAKYGKKEVDGKYGQFAGLKYWKNGVSTWQTMNGEAISSEKSIIGTGFYFYMNGAQPTEDNQLNFTFTQTKLVKTLFGGMRWRTIQIGSKQSGYSRQFKYQKAQPIK